MRCSLSFVLLGFSLLVVGCSPSKPDPIQIMIDDENVGWEVMQVYPQKQGVMVRLRGRRDEKRNIYVNSENHDPGAQVGEIWRVEYKESTFSSARLYLTNRLYTKEEARPLRR